MKFISLCSIFPNYKLRLIFEDLGSIAENMTIAGLVRTSRTLQL